ncbi:type VI secretion system-associated protein TagF [Aquabacterium sp. NJ1]|uniref:type VI secretion system-associated protein TagF n=1 Tax=Aquabacterium sp. NJ1 TaxID=1538295 RepID=UPI0006919D82|nr:type VI secretion system-associated protein TagF [Aquabacterium sp. NJ1]
MMSAGGSAVGSTCGWFGKIASLGDFSARRLPPEFVQRCDDWLSRGVQTSRAQLGERWLNTYLTAPIWRFAWSPGIAGPHWWMGVMMPSVDSVGRYFPLVVAQASAYAPDSGQDHTALQRWMDHVAQAAMSTLHAGAQVDAFEARLMDAPTWQAAPPVGAPNLQRLVGRDRYQGAPHPSLSHWLEGVAGMSLHQQVQGQSLWWLPDSGHGSGSLSLGPGLPGQDHFVELLQGSW